MVNSRSFQPGDVKAQLKSDATMSRRVLCGLQELDEDDSADSATQWRVSRIHGLTGLSRSILSFVAISFCPIR